MPFSRGSSAVDGKIKSYLLVDAAGARAKAKAAEAEIKAGRWRGPLHGIPYGAKDTFYTKGLRTCANSRVLLDFVPDYDAAIIEKLDAAGAILLGKLNTWEYGTGLGFVYHDAAFAHSTNPWKDGYFTGGSSTGSGAAVAAGTAMFALGADTGGSIRAPAAGCGIQGLKPTYGRVSRHGILPNCWSLDVAGPHDLDDRGLRLVLQAIAGYRCSRPGCADVPVPNYLDSLANGVAGADDRDHARHRSFRSARSRQSRRHRGYGVGRSCRQARGWSRFRSLSRPRSIAK